MRKEDASLLVPGMRIRIASKLMGEELYGAEDPMWMQKWLGQEAIVESVEMLDVPIVRIEDEDENGRPCFYMEEIDCIVADDDLEESDVPLSKLLEI